MRNYFSLCLTYENSVAVMNLVSFGSCARNQEINTIALISSSKNVNNRIVNFFSTFLYKIIWYYMAVQDCFKHVVSSDIIL